MKLASIFNNSKYQGHIAIAFLKHNLSDEFFKSAVSENKLITFLLTMKILSLRYLKPYQEQ